MLPFLGWQRGRGRESFSVHDLPSGTRAGRKRLPTPLRSCVTSIRTRPAAVFVHAESKTGPLPGNRFPGGGPVWIPVRIAQALPGTR